MSALGRQQAEATARALLERDPPQAIYSSPYPRCVQTAEPLSAALRLNPVFDDRLVEFEMAQQSFATVLTRPDLLIWDAIHRGRPTGETLREFSSRVYEWLDELAEQHSGSSVTVFTHSGVIDAVIRWSVGLSPDAPWVHDFPLSNASITEMEFWPRGRVNGGGPRYTAFERVGDTAHLFDCNSAM